MSETAAFPNVLNACSVEGRLVLLQGLAEQLESCQKSLSDYLDSKRSIFPRCVPTPVDREKKRGGSYLMQRLALVDRPCGGPGPLMCLPALKTFMKACYIGRSTGFVNLQSVPPQPWITGIRQASGWILRALFRPVCALGPVSALGPYLRVGGLVTSVGTQ